MEHLLRDEIQPLDDAHGRTGLTRLLIFLDDLFLASDTQAGLLDLTERVLRKLEEVGARLNSSKCEFGVQKVKYLGHVISADGLEPDPDKVSCVMKAKVPTSKTELRSFLGLTHYYGKFCPDLSSVCAPLNNLLRDDSEFVWNDLCDQAFCSSQEPFVQCSDLGTLRS